MFGIIFLIKCSFIDCHVLPGQICKKCKNLKNTAAVVWEIFTKNTSFQSYSAQCSHQLPGEDGDYEVYQNVGTASTYDTVNSKNWVTQSRDNTYVVWEETTGKHTCAASAFCHISRPFT